MTDIALDPATGDLDLTGGGLNLVRGAEEVAQELRIRFLFFKGEWFLNPEEGIPYHDEILGQKVSQQVVDSIFRKVITTCPGVQSLDSFESSLDQETRVLTLNFVCTADNGESIIIDEGFLL